MALLFLDTSKEASRFSTSLEEAYVRIAPNHSTKNSAIWGVHQQNMYLGFGNEDEDQFDKIVYINRSSIGIGTSLLTATCTIINPNTSLDSNVYSVLNVQDAFHINQEGTVFIKPYAQSNISTNQLHVSVPSNFYSSVQFKETIKCEGDSFTVTSPFIQFGTKIIQIGSNSNSQIHLQGSIAFNGPCESLNTMTMCEPVLIQKDLTLNGNLYMISDIYANSLNLKKELTTPSIFSKKLTLGEGITVQGGTSVFLGNIAIGSTNHIYPDYLYISKHIELPPQSRIGIGKKAQSSIDVVGDISGDGHLIIAKTACLGTNSQINQTHKVYGNLQVVGTNHLWKGNHRMDGMVHITQKCIIGQDYCSSLLHVYGPVHVKENLYVHKQLLVDNDMYINGQIYFTSEVARDECQLKIPSGSIEIQKGNLHVNTVSSQMGGYVFTVKGNSYLDGDIKANGCVEITDNVTLKNNLTLHKNIYVQKELHVNEHLYANNQIHITGDATIKQNLSIGKQLYVEKDVFIGTTSESLLTVNGKCHINQCIETPLLKTAKIEVSNEIRYQNRRYGIRQTPLSEGYCIKWIHIPNRKGKTAFFVRMKGILYTSTSTLQIEMELGGNTQDPIHKKSILTGELTNEYGSSVLTFVQILFYRTQYDDYIGCIRVPPSVYVGYDLDFEMDARYDYFMYGPLDSKLPRQENWSIWWDIIASAHVIYKRDSIQIHRKMGIAESNPLYMLDVKSDARFQGKLLQPSIPNISMPTSIPSIQHNDQTYYAISDIFQWLIQSVKELQQK